VSLEGKTFKPDDLKMMKQALDGVVNALALESEQLKERAAAIIVHLAGEMAERSSSSLCEEAIRVLRRRR